MVGGVGAGASLSGEGSTTGAGVKGVDWVTLLSQTVDSRVVLVPSRKNNRG